jgi:deoxycytidylate deaminase
MKIDAGVGPCQKLTVTATIVAPDGSVFVATNYCDTPQIVCPRSGLPTGIGYELCKSVCNQRNHAEVNAILLAGDAAKGGTLYLEGHTYCCKSCLAAATDAGIASVILGPRP